MRVHELSSEWYEHFVSAEDDSRELKIYVSENLNERYYGDLQGRNKDRAREEFGVEQAHLWRRSYGVPPPNGESLEMTAARVIPYFQARIAPCLQPGGSVLVSAHGNSLRAIIMHLEQLTEEQIVALDLPTGTPRVYRFDAAKGLFEKQKLYRETDVG